MSDNDDQLIIQESAASQFITLLVLAAFDSMLIELIREGLLDKYADISIYTIPWWLWMFALFAATIPLTILIIFGFIAIFRFSFRYSDLIIDSVGILQPFTDPKNKIRWKDILTYYIEEPEFQKTPCKYLYIEISNPKISMANIFRKKKILLIGRELTRLDDFDRVVYYVNKYFMIQ